MLMIEVFEIINGLAPPIMEDFFLFRENAHNIRNFQIISNEPKKTVRYVLETLKYRTSLLWANLLEKYKTATSLNSLKTKFKTWKSETCVCQLCQTYHHFYKKYLQQSFLTHFNPVSHWFTNNNIWCHWFTNNDIWYLIFQQWVEMSFKK